jgi:hypothetical protein
VNGAFGALGTVNLTIRVYPSIKPFTWVPPDPIAPQGQPPILEGFAPLTYHLGQLKVDFVSDDPVNPLPLQLAIDFYDEWFSVDFSETADLLTPKLDKPLWALTILDSKIPGCPMMPHVITPIGAVNPCEASLVGALHAFLTPELEERMLGMLSDVPAPLTFDVTGMATPGRRFVNDETYVWGQRVVFYGHFEIP